MKVETRQELFQHMINEHNLILLESELDHIIYMCAEDELILNRELKNRLEKLENEIKELNNKLNGK